MTELEFALNTFYLLMSGAFVMWMAAGFTMLEAGLVRSKNAAEIVTKNLGLFSIACVIHFFSILISILDSRFINFSNSLYLRNLQEQLKKAFCYQKLF